MTDPVERLEISFDEFRQSVDRRLERLTDAIEQLVNVRIDAAEQKETNKRIFMAIEECRREHQKEGSRHNARLKIVEEQMKTVTRDMPGLLNFKNVAFTTVVSIVSALLVAAALKGVFQ